MKGLQVKSRKAVRRRRECGGELKGLCGDEERCTETKEDGCRRGEVDKEVVDCNIYKPWRGSESSIALSSVFYTYIFPFSFLPVSCYTNKKKWGKET